MSVDSGEPRQRTVAELLAENNGAQTGRRRRRRAVDDEPDAGFVDAPVDAGRVASPPRLPEPPPSREPVPYGAPPRGAGNGAPRPSAFEPSGYEPNGYASNGYGSNGGHGPDGYGSNGANGHGPHGRDANGYGATGSDRGAPAPAGYGRGGQDGGYDTGAPDREAFRPPAPRGAPAGPPPRPEPYPDRPAPPPPPQALAPQSVAPQALAPQSVAPQALAPQSVAPQALAPQAPPPAPPYRGEPVPPPGPPVRGGGRTEQIARFDETGDGPTGAFDTRPPRGADADGCPPTQYGAPVLDDDGGPPTQLGGPPLHDDVDGEWTDCPEGEADDVRPRGRRAPVPSDGGPPTEAGFGPADLDDLDDDYEDHGERAAGLTDDEDEPPRRKRGLLGRRTAAAEADRADAGPDVDDVPPERAAGTGQAWAMVIAQWIGGAVVGAGVWVGFRYLWFSLPVVALALAVVLTVGLVLGVRALLRNDDLKTTMFAVLVGLLLTVSPAILVLLDR
ncbi:hypothetical protein EV383_5497 [Pseudonocardia sediminis]|uniref:Uncharacterized protein n=1 Tax=Pseudonocardia sediminis TaxID=1397368 RepID=A0A4Q7V500_PSEST|nr:hypothetical protein [Pseudonocardia sediminis]RZT88554.1 hypothetical protein EV383_5497 [Pseudonocardia sediminis]